LNWARATSSRQRGYVAAEKDVLGLIWLAKINIK